MKQQREQLQRRIQYSFRNEELLQRALRHRSAGSDHNERLEFLGDSLLGTIISAHLFQLDSDASEGQLTRRRSALVRKESLAEVAKLLDLGSALELGPSASRSGGRNNDSILADAIEALLAAVYLDSDFETVRDVTLGLMQPVLEKLDQSIEQQVSLRDGKTRLQEWLQARSLPLPEYRMTEVTGPGHARHFEVECDVQPLGQSVSGSGSSRRDAEQEAAAATLAALEALGL